MNLKIEIRDIKEAAQRNWSSILIVAVFAIIYSLISLVNHYNFRTGAHDLGIFNQAMYDYSLFRFNKATLILPNSDIGNLLADHFSVLQMVFSPLRYIFGSYTLLIVQIAIVLTGGWGIKRYVRLYTDDKVIPILAQIHYYVSFGVIAALGFDYHDSVLAAMFVPHLLYFARLNNYKGVIVMTILFLLSRVELSIWMFFIAFSLLLLYWKDAKARWLYSSIALFSIIYFITIIHFVIPSLGKDGYTQFQFNALGSNMGDVLKFALTHPFETISYLIKDQHTGSYEGFLIKRDFYLAMLLSGGYLMFFRPIYLIMLFPVVAQRMLHDSTLKWGIHCHYSIESVTILSMAVFTSLLYIRNTKMRRGIGIFIVLSTIFCTGFYWNNRHPMWLDTTPENPFIKQHYTNSFDVKEMHRALKMIPDKVPVSAQSSLVPHLSFREKIYLYPFKLDAEYIVLNENTTVYPMRKENYEKSIRELKESEEWETVYNKNHSYIFKKVKLIE